MSLNHSPAVVTDGLVMYYDMGNTQKSWKGAPAINLLSNPNIFTATYWALQNMTRTSSVEIAPDGTPTASLFTVTTGYTPLYQQKSGQTAGATFTMSGHFKAGTGTTVNFLLGNTGLTNYTNVLFNLTTGTITSTAVVGTGTYINSAITSLGNGWYRCQVTGIVDSSATLIRTDYVFPNSSTIYGCNMQLEVGSFATPFIDGTRTTTTALLDLAGKNTLTATSLTYASDNTFSFNGTSNYISCGNFGTFYPNGTISLWINSAVMANWNNPFSTHASNAGIRFEENAAGNFLVVVGNDAATFTAHTYFASGMAINTWYNIVLVWNVSGNNVIGYLNGTQVFNEAQTYWATTMPTVTIGVWGARYWNGSISNVGIYNTSLSADQVKQNFNALRGRFGI